MAGVQPASLDPGAAPYGNFPNYYSFNPPETRVRLLPPGLLHKFITKSKQSHSDTDPSLLGLDVGCNTGELSVALYKHLQQATNESPEGPVDIRFLCCDMDADLIAKAQMSNPFPGLITYVAQDVMDNSALQGLLQNYLDGLERTSFDIGFCMSVTMWIHLNYGDQGLVSFLHRLASFCDYLLIEPQPWKCYRSAARRLRKLGRHDFEHFHSLSIRGDMAENITQILTTGGNAELVHCFGNTRWARGLLLFKTRRISQLLTP